MAEVKKHPKAEKPAKQAGSAQKGTAAELKREPEHGHKPGPKHNASHSPKHDPKHGPKHDRASAEGTKHEARQLQRVYEHLGRVESLERMAPSPNASARTLVALAREQMQAGRVKDAAELLRAAEHFCFAALAAATDDATVAAPVEAAVRAEWARLVEKAEPREDGGRGWRALQARALEEAGHALAEGGYHRALELARAAEALGHVAPEADLRLSTGQAAPRLAAS